MIALLVLTLNLLAHSPLGGVSASHASPPPESIWYSALPKSEQALFLKRYNLAIKFRKQRKWQNLYELRPKEEEPSLEQFTKEMSQTDFFVDFRPDSMYYIQETDKWVIRGRGRFRKPSGKEYSYPCSMRAYHILGTWFFTDVAVDVH